MTIDPARLARIRSRLLAAAAVTAVGAAGCGGPEHVNTRAPEPPSTGPIINEPAPEPVTTGSPETAPSGGPDAPDINRPKPDKPRPDTVNTARPND
jgi:hypothetical protein